MLVFPLLRKGAGLLCIVLVWGAFIIEVPAGFSLRRAYLLAGLLEAMSGGFLLAWVFYFLEVLGARLTALCFIFDFFKVQTLVALVGIVPRLEIHARCGCYSVNIYIFFASVCVHAQPSQPAALAAYALKSLVQVYPLSPGTSTHFPPCT